MTKKIIATLGLLGAISLLYAAGTAINGGRTLAVPLGVASGGTGVATPLSQIPYCPDTSSSTTTYTATCSPAVTAYTTGMRVSFLPANANTGASTLNIGGVAATAITLGNTAHTALAADDMITGAGPYTFEYDGTRFLKISGPPTAWVGFAFANSWSDQGGGIQTGQYMKDNSGRVWLRGSIKPGTTTANTNMFTLPAGYRPSATRVLHYLTLNTNAGPEPGQISIYSDGTVLFEATLAGTVSIVDLEAISFSVY